MTQLQVDGTTGAPAGGGRTSGPTLVWLTQAFTGALVLVLVTVHMIANHFLAPGGLRTYAQVADYLSNPFVFAIEVAFLLTVTVHGLLGVRAVVLDRGPAARTMRRLDRGLLILGGATVAYGLTLLALIASRG